jgi:hypothetical protein
MEKENITVPEAVLSRSSAHDVISQCPPNDDAAFEMTDMHPPRKAQSSETRLTSRSHAQKNGLERWWAKYISLSVPYEHRRDHLCKFI